MTVRSELVDLEATIHWTTKPGEENEGAYLVETAESSPRKEWVPKSVAELEWKDQRRKSATITMPRVIAESKGLV